jgi:hypothetical protein
MSKALVACVNQGFPSTLWRRLSILYILATPQPFYEIFAIFSVLKKLKPFCDSPTQYSGQKIANFCSKK